LLHHGRGDIARVMAPAWSRVLRALFVVYVAATAIHIGWVIAHEPFGFDAWNVAHDTHAQPFSVSRLFGYWWYEYTHGNPRVGQVFAYASYKLEYFAVIATPLAYLALACATFVLGTARLPSWRRGRDLGLWAIAIGFLWFALPQVGKTLFNRAYGANYVYAAAIQLWFLVPLRLRPNGQASWRACAAYFAFGVIAGACNEHTGPTLCAFMVGYAWWLRGKTEARPTLAWSGALGVVVGFAAIFLAPGQGERYDSLAQKVSLVGRVIQRGVVGNLEILRDLVLASAPLLALILIVLIVVKDDGNERRAALRKALSFVGLVVAAALAMAVTMFVSPKLGPRFFYVSTSLLLAGFIAVADAVLVRRTLAAFVVIAIAASAYAAARTVPLYGRLARDSAARLDEMAAQPRHSIYVAEALEQVDESWWFLGDDLRDEKKRALVATYFDLTGVRLRAYAPNVPLGISTVKLVPRAELDPQGCLPAGLTLGAVKAFDLDGIHREIKLAIDSLRFNLGPIQLRALDVEVSLGDVSPPRPNLLLARWRPDGYESYEASIERRGRDRMRKIALPAELRNGDVEIVIYQVGGKSYRLGAGDDVPLQYVPWKTGVYWVLACRRDACFVIAASRQGA